MAETTTSKTVIVIDGDGSEREHVAELISIEEGDLVLKNGEKIVAHYRRWGGVFRAEGDR